MQNLPRAGNVRSIFIPPPGKVLVAVDYSQLELCSLAQHCLTKYGFSKLAETINSGVDVHKYLASIVTGRPPSEITKQERQGAKAGNFGFPGGLGSKAFMDYAKVSYGVDMDAKQSQEIRNAWLAAFPEMAKHLQPDYDAQNDWYVAKTLTGRFRGECSFCEACNSVFQGLAADGGKLMLWESFKEDIPVTNFVHGQTSPLMLY